MEAPRLYVEDRVELCDGHSDYGTSILYSECGGSRTEIFRTRYETNRMNEQTEGILSFTLDRREEEWVVTILLLDGGKESLASRDGRLWR